MASCQCTVYHCDISVDHCHGRTPAGTWVHQRGTLYNYRAFGALGIHLRRESGAEGGCVLVNNASHATKNSI